MNWVHPTALLLSAWVVAFLQASPWWARWGVGVQPDVLPALVVYTAFNASLATTVGVAVLGGFSYDALSSGPFGASLLPLVWVGVLMHLRRDLILKESAWSQVSLGLVGTLWVIGMSLMLLWVFGPLVDTGSLPPVYYSDWRAGGDAGPESGVRWIWQGVLLVSFGALASPLIFRFFGWIDATFNYRPVNVPVSRGDREIQRGRF